MRDFTSVPFDEIRQHKISEPCPDTGEWFLSSEVFKKWRDTPENSLLHVCGSSGQGKSVLAKMVTDYLERALGKSCAVIYFFCFKQEESSSHASDILRMLIIQLIDCQELFEHLPREFQFDSDKFSTASLPKLWDLFETLLSNKKTQRIYCVIDALDECSDDNEQRSDLSRRFKKLVSKEGHRVRILITSRLGERDIGEQLDGSLSWTLKAHPADLEKFIKSKAKHLPRIAYNDELKNKIESLLLKRAGGTFLWVSIVIIELTRLEVPSLREVEEVFAVNPVPLNDLYRKIVQRIVATDTPTSTFAKLLVWVAYSERPLCVEELKEAIMCDPSIANHKSLSMMRRDRREINRDLIISKLGALVEISTKVNQDFVYFNHQSVRDYFHHSQDEVLKNLKFMASDGPDLYLARTCMMYLSAEELRSPLKKEHHPFFDYASSQWHKHIKTTIEARFELRQVTNLLGHVESWLKIRSRGHLETICNIDQHRLEQCTEGSQLSISASDLAIELDISWLAELIISHDFNGHTFNKDKICSMVSRAPSAFETLLRFHIKKIPLSKVVIRQVVLSPMCKQWIDLLLKHRAQDIEITEDLIVAATENKFLSPFEVEKVVPFLLDHSGAAESKLTKKLLMAAAMNPDTTLMRLLLTRAGNRLRIPPAVLLQAFKFDNDDVVRILLEQQSAHFIITDFNLKFPAAGSRLLQPLLEYRKRQYLGIPGVCRTVDMISSRKREVRRLLEKHADTMRSRAEMAAAATKSLPSIGRVEKSVIAVKRGHKRSPTTFGFSLFKQIRPINGRSLRLSQY